MKKKILIDFEFTGIDNTFVNDNEIIQFKFIDTNNINNNGCYNFGSKKIFTAYSQIQFQAKKFKTRDKFNSNLFNEILNYNKLDKDVEFYGWNVKQDILMLKKYDIDINIIDLKEMMMRSKYEYRMATEGNSFEICYFILFGRTLSNDFHSNISEMYFMNDMYNSIKKLRKKEYLTVMPWGHCAGMPISEYICFYRKAADGYRFNNSDLLQRSLSYYIYKEETLENDNDDDDDWYF